MQLPHPELQNAARFDAAGNHDEAINCLARGTQAGSAACMAQLGLRLATADRAPLLVREGMEMLGEAAGNGEPGAAARGAALIALGTNLPAPDWRLALQWLVRAAQLGHDVSQRQLLALCDDRQLAQQASALSGMDWSVVAAAIDLAAWRRAPAPRFLSQDPRICAFERLIRPELCEFFSSLAPGRLGPAHVYDPVAGSDIVVAHRSNTQAVFGLTTAEFGHALLQARISAACGQPVAHMEAPAVLHYSPGEEIANHYDFVDPKSTQDYAAEIARNGQRLITFLVYLNESYAGGETDFPSLGISNKGRTGDALYFVNALADLSPDVRTLHAGRPPRDGEKWLITQFVRSRPTR
jgi:prolyl 4-hydroxylase